MIALGAKFAAAKENTSKTSRRPSVRIPLVNNHTALRPNQVERKESVSGRKKLYRRQLPSSRLTFYSSRYGFFVLNDVVWQFYRNFTSERISQDPMARRLRLVSRHSRSLRTSDEEIPFLASEYQVSRRPQQRREGLKAWCFDRFYAQNQSNWRIIVGIAAVGAIMLLSWIMCVQLILLGQIRS